ncbi:MAG: hypothetical protein KGI98_16120 [Euryarchaeota archaeon]|nr:hypothetical protein [Euryarchaeota archaeon]MDE1879525.1 hypothetical protein [Euryarchaeota archaeon]
MHPLGVVLLVVGVALLGAAALTQTGAIPLHVVGCGTPTTPCNPPALRAGLTYHTSGLTLSVTDSSYVSLLTKVSVSFNWGDGTGTSGPYSTGATATHVYSTAGTYALTQHDVGYSGTQKYTASASFSITLSGSSNTSGKGGGTVVTNVTCVNAATSYCATFGGVFFTAVSNGPVANFTDQSLIINMHITSVQWSFGDGANASGTYLGSIQHTYAINGTYLVTETITASGVVYPNTPVTWTKAYSENVTVGTAGCGSTCPTPPSSSALNPWAAVLAILGGTLIGGVFIPTLPAKVSVAVAGGAGILVVYVLTIVGVF